MNEPHQSTNMKPLNNINVPFRIFIPTGGSRFTVPLKKHLLKDEYLFHFDHLILSPDLYNKESQVKDYDPDLENESEERYPFQLDFNYAADFYKTEQNANKYIQDAKRHTDHNSTLIAINTFFEGTKVVTQKYPPVIFDWSLLAPITAHKDVNEYHKNGLFLLYKAKVDDPSLHDWLPPGSRMPGINNWQFPTTISDSVVASTIRIRMHLAPNVEIGFSNENLLNAFGFSTNQYTPKSTPSAQIKFFNSHPTEYLTIVGEKPVGDLTISQLNKITLYVYKKKVRSPEGVLTTKRKNLIKPEKLAEDYNKGFSEMAEKSVHSLSLDYTPSERKFKFTYPATPGLTTDIYIDPEAAEQLGYPRGTHKITQGTEPGPIKNATDITDIVKESMTIVYDVGLATVSHDDDTDFQTQQFTNKVMATLYPKKDGTMKMSTKRKPYSPKAFLSYFAMPQLAFTISRFSENGQPVPLSLPTGSYISGELVGQKYTCPTDKQTNNEKRCRLHVTDENKL